MSPDPCSPMTNNASLPTLFSLELLDETKEPLSDRQEFSSAIMCKPTKAHAFTFSAEMLSPNRNSSLKTLAHTSLGRSTAWRLCVDVQCPMHPEKAKGPLPTKAGSDPNPQGHRSLQPRSHISLHFFSRLQDPNLLFHFACSSSAFTRLFPQNLKPCL